MPDGLATVSTVDLRPLRAAVAGIVLGPDDPGYDEARATWNQNIDQHPAVIVRPARAADIAAAVRFAGAHSLPFAVQSTGHGAVFACDDGLLVNTSGMTGVHVDAEARTARVDPGVTWAQVLAETHKAGLVGLCGYVASVGVVGYALGGGVGWLTRKYGLGADSILAADVVLADGSAVRASATEHPDLFWALRGGSGNFGVVTALTLRCYPVRQVYGGTLQYPLALAGQILRRWAAWTRTTPDELTSSVSILRMPNDPTLPAAVRDQLTVHLGVCVVGSGEDGAEADGGEALGRALMRPWADLTPLAGALTTVEGADLGAIEGGPAGGLRTYTACEEFRTLDDGAIDAITATFGPDTPLRMIEIRHTGGAAARVPADATAADHRDAVYVAQVQSLLETPAQTAAARRATAALHAALRPFATGGTSLSFLPDGDEGVALAQRAFSPGHYARLRAVKAAYDPGNFFCLNYNVAPAAAHA